MLFDHPQPDQADEPFQMTAMVDVVFILLTFFIVSASFVGREHDLTLGNHTQALAQGAQADDFPSQIDIQLHSVVDSKVQIILGQRELALNGFEEITQWLEQINLPQVPVVVTADPTLTVEQVALALDSILASPMKKVRLGPPAPPPEIPPEVFPEATP